MPTCGDGMLAPGLEHCDDGNLKDRDGCSSSCTVEDYFECNATTDPSKCALVSMNVSMDSMAKTEDRNEIILTMDLFPTDLAAYATADWLLAFRNFSCALLPSWVEYDRENSQLMVGFFYTENLQG
jgi:cysteine-rich repeat protein